MMRRDLMIDFWCRFQRNKGAVLGLAILLIVVLVLGPQHALDRTRRENADSGP